MGQLSPRHDRTGGDQCHHRAAECEDGVVASASDRRGGSDDVEGTGGSAGHRPDGAVRHYVKEVYACDCLRAILPRLWSALQTAVEHPRGPVYVEIPIDLLYSIQEVRANMGLSKRVLAKNLPRDERIDCYVPD